MNLSEVRLFFHILQYIYYTNSDLKHQGSSFLTIFDLCFQDMSKKILKIKPVLHGPSNPIEPSVYISNLGEKQLFAPTKQVAVERIDEVQRHQVARRAKMSNDFCLAFVHSTPPARALTHYNTHTLSSCLLCVHMYTWCWRIIAPAIGIHSSVSKLQCVLNNI
jgi:hypothetical protein